MRTTLVTIPVAFALVAAGCHHAAPPQVTVAPAQDVNPVEERAPRDTSPPSAQPQPADSGTASRRTAEQIKAVLTAMIHFDFDKSAIRPGDAEALDQKVSILRGNPSVRIQIAGNCDERGSDEYNLALGNRRAISARAYLVNHGIDAGRIETMSNGKERPIDPGHNEEAWAMNRNDQFSILNPNVVLLSP
ncbi:MAG TPA: OmpA family protein [Gemmatimonadales bacterium]